MVKEKDNPIENKLDKLDFGTDLVLYNDDVHSFDFVIEALIEVCEHEHLQAEQCAFIAHYNGKCPVKSGHFSELKPRYDELIRRGLTVSIESV
jgi:ATP-dependent Clp protease adaptor protein ClpS